LLLLVCLPLWVRAESGTSTIANSWGNFKDVYEKSKTMYGSIKDNGSAEVAKLKESLKNLSEGLEKDNMTKEGIEALIKQVQSDANGLKDNDAISNLTKDFESLKNSAEQAIERIKDLKDNGLVYSMPVGFKKKFGNFSVNCKLDSLRFIRGENPNSESEDVTLVNASLGLGLPFVTSSADSSHVVKFSGENIRLAGANSDTKIFLESNHRVTLMKDKVAIEILSQRPTNPSELGMCSTSDDRTWVSFNCNGIQDMNLVGRFIFSNSFIYAASDKPATNDGKSDGKTDGKSDGSQPTPANNDNTQPANTGAEAANSGDANKGDGKGGEAKNAPGPGTVYAYFNIHGGDFLASICFSDSFKVKGCGDFVFSVQDAIVDLSDSLNAAGFSFPSGYWDENAALGLKEEAWTGFFLRKLNVHFPKDLDFNDSKDKSGKLEVSNVFIDDYGFTGSVLLTDFINKGNHDKDGTQKKKNTGLGLQIDTIGVQFYQGDFTSGLVSGEANVPFLGNASEQDSVVNGADLKFRGFVGYNPATDHYTYNASIKIQHETEFKVPFTERANIKLTSGEFNIKNNDSTNAVTASLVLDGSLNIDSKLSLKGIRFEELKFSNRKPNVDVKSLSLIGSAGISFAGMSVQLKGLSWSPKNGFKPEWGYDVDQDALKKTANDALDKMGVDTDGIKDKASNLKDKVTDMVDLEQTTSGALGLNAKIKLIPGENSLAADLGLDINSEFGDSDKWKFKNLSVRKICLNADFSAFKFDGCVEHFEDNDTFGTGFRGYVDLTLKELGFGIGAQACFGKVKSKKNEGEKFQYWYAKANVEFGGAPIMVFPPCVMIKSFSGGAYHCMGGKSILDNVGNPQKIHLSNVNDYVPTEDVGFGFIAGVGLYIGNDKLVNANVELEMNFNSKWGLNQIKFIGLASMMTTLTTKDSTTSGSISGWLAAEYNRPERKFATQAGIDVAFGEVLNGSGTMDLYTGPDGWHFYLGTNKNPNKLKFIKMLTARSYFMLGKIPSRLSPMNETVANHFKVSQSGAQGQDDVVESAKGFAFGLDIHAGTDCSSKRKIVFAEFSLDAGCDLMVGPDDCGKAKWRARGDVYIFANGAAGVDVKIKIPFRKKKLKKRFTIIKGTVYAIMDGTIPAPAYARGTVGMDVDVLFIKIHGVKISMTVGSDKCLQK